MAECKTACEFPVLNFENKYQEQFMQQVVAEPTAPIYESTASTRTAGIEPLPVQGKVETSEATYQNQGAAASRPTLPPRRFTMNQVPDNPAPDSKHRWICVFVLLAFCLVVLVIVGAVAIYALLTDSETGSKILENQKKLLEEQLKIREKLDKDKKDLLYRLPGATCIEANNYYSWYATRKTTIYPPGLDRGVDVYCDGSDGGGWIVLQRRSDYTSVDFDRHTSEYAKGFGNAHNYWIGLDKLHNLTSHAEYELRIDLEDWCEETAYAEYSNFHVGNAHENYILTISEYNGTAGDSLASSNGREFSTSSFGYNYCSRRRSGGWWFDDSSFCFTTNLNGQLYNRSSLYYSAIYSCPTYNPNCDQCLRSSSTRKYGIFWTTFGGGPGVLKTTKMRMRLKPASVK